MRSRQKRSQLWLLGKGWKGKASTYRTRDEVEGKVDAVREGDAARDQSTFTKTNDLGERLLS